MWTSLLSIKAETRAFVWLWGEGTRSTEPCPQAGLDSSFLLFTLSLQMSKIHSPL